MTAWLQPKFQDHFYSVDSRFCCCSLFFFEKKTSFVRYSLLKSVASSSQHHIVEHFRHVCFFAWFRFRFICVFTLLYGFWSVSFSLNSIILSISLLPGVCLFCPFWFVFCHVNCVLCALCLNSMIYSVHVFSALHTAILVYTRRRHKTQDIHRTPNKNKNNTAKIILQSKRTLCMAIFIAFE